MTVKQSRVRRSQKRAAQRGAGLNKPAIGLDKPAEAKTPVPPESPGGLGAAPVWKPSDAPLAARMIALGCVPEQQVEIVLRGFVKLAGEAIGRTVAGADGKAVTIPGNARDYAAAMKVAIAVARLQLEREKLDGLRAMKPQPSQINIQFNTLIGQLKELAVEDLERLENVIDAVPVRENSVQGSDSPAQGATQG